MRKICSDNRDYFSPACGKTAIKKVSVAAVCDGVTIKRIEQPRTADSGDPEALVGLA